MRSPQFHDALKELTKAIREVEAVVETLRASTTHWRHTSSFHAANIGTLTTRKAENAR
jgi:nicotinamidase-related amidase